MWKLFKNNRTGRDSFYSILNTFFKICNKKFMETQRRSAEELKNIRLSFLFFLKQKLT